MDKVSNSDIIFGHSQGAILTAALLSIHDKLWKTPAISSSTDRPMGYILNGVAWPNPYKDSLKSLATQQQQQQNSETNNSSNVSSLPRMLFIMGKEDNINPIESAMQVHDAYQKANFNVSIVNHDRGHSVPVGKDEDSVRALNEIVNWIVDIAKEKRRKKVA
jgi:predicted esterase